MSPTLSEDTRRRLTLGLVIAPPHRNRRRNLRLSLTTRILSWLERHCSLI